MGEDSNQRGGSRGGGTQDLTDDYDFGGQQHEDASARAVWTVRRFTDSSDLWKDTLDTLTACGVPVDRLLTMPQYLFVAFEQYHIFERTSFS